MKGKIFLKQFAGHKPGAVLVASVLWVFAVCLCLADSPVKVSLSIKDRVEKSDSRDEEIKENGAGTEITITTELEEEVCTLEVSLRQSSQDELSCQLEWYFLSEYTAGNRADEVVKIFSPGSKEIRLAKMAREKISVVSDPFVFKTISRDDSSADDLISGDVYKGYIVLVTSDGEILAKASNSSLYLKEEWLSKCRAD